MSKTYNTYLYEEFGFNNLKIVTLNKPEKLEPNEILVSTESVSVNPWDWKRLEGKFMTLPVPYTPGLDFSGVVEAVGSAVTYVKVGDGVMGMKNKTFSQYIIVNENDLVKKPENISFEEAAALPEVCLTSYQALVEKAEIKAGSKVVILGGSGGCGGFGIQIAKILGAYVAATCSTANVDYVKSLGADVVIDYRQEDWAVKLKGGDWDVLYDSVGDQNSLTRAGEVVKEGGTFVTIVGEIKSPTKLKVMFVFAKNQKPQLETIAKWAEEGKFKIKIDSKFPFQDAAKALEKSKEGRAVGKIIINTQK